MILQDEHNSTEYDESIYMYDRASKVPTCAEASPGSATASVGPVCAAASSDSVTTSMGKLHLALSLHLWVLYVQRQILQLHLWVMCLLKPRAVGHVCAKRNTATVTVSVGPVCAKRNTATVTVSVAPVCAGRYV